MSPFRVYVQLKGTTHTSKEGETLNLAGEKQVFIAEATDIDEAWCLGFTSSPNVQRVLIPV